MPKYTRGFIEALVFRFRRFIFVSLNKYVEYAARNNGQRQGNLPFGDAHQGRHEHKPNHQHPANNKGGDNVVPGCKTFHWS